MKKRRTRLRRDSSPRGRAARAPPHSRMVALDGRRQCKNAGDGEAADYGQQAADEEHWRQGLRAESAATGEKWGGMKWGMRSEILGDRRSGFTGGKATAVAYTHAIATVASDRNFRARRACACARTTELLPSRVSRHFFWRSSFLPRARVRKSARAQRRYVSGQTACRRCSSHLAVRRTRAISLVSVSRLIDC